MKHLFEILAAVVLRARSSQAPAILISASGGTDASQTISNVTIGNQLTVTCQFTDPYVGVDGIECPSVSAHLFVGHPSCSDGLLQNSRSAATGTITGPVDTTAFAGQVRDLGFDVDLFDDTTAFTTDRILDVPIDRQSIGVPAPLALLAIGLLGFVLVS